jgi:hypothetical protein
MRSDPDHPNKEGTQTDTPTNSNDEEDLSLRWNVEVASLAGGTLQTDLFLLLRKVLLDIGLGTLEDDLSLGF